jgi:serine/threonine-protein kinase
MGDLPTGLSAGSLLGGYRVESLVARGGMGVIYKATQLALDRIVALKVVAPELAHDQAFRERFKRESLLAAALDHPNILPVYEAGEVDGQLFLAMRYVVGTDMDSLIRREQALPPERATAIVAQVAGALDAAHSRGLVHRDVKPGNILIAEEYGEERAYLTDFGLTKHAATEARLTRTGYMVGTLDYVAPEQVQGGDVDGRVDTYALACVLYQAVTGRVPFDRPSDAAKLWAHLNEPPPSAAAASPAVSSQLDAVIRRGMAKRPEERYASSGEFARAAHAAAAPTAQRARTELEATQIEPTVVEPLLAATPAPETGDRGGPPGRSGLRRVLDDRRRVAYGAGALLVLLIGAIVAIAAGGGGGKASPGTAAAAANSPAAATTTTVPTVTGTDTAAARASAYHAQVAAIFPRMEAVFNRFPKARDFGKPAFSQTSLSVAAGLRGIADNLDTLSPPSQVLVDHEALVTHLREMEQAFRSLAVDSDNRAFGAAHNDLNKTKVGLAQINASVRRVLANQ